MSSQQSELQEPIGRSVGTFLTDTFERYASRPCLYCDEERATYGEVRDSIFRYGRALQELKLSQGDGIAVLSTNSLESFYATWAIRAIGARQVTLHPLGSLEDHLFILHDADAQALVFSPRFDQRAMELGRRSERLRVLASLGPSTVGEDLTSIAAHQESGPLPAVGPQEVSKDDQPAAGYTGGTTGRPKGVVISTETMGFLATAMLTQWQWPPDLRFLISTPMSHAAGAILPPLLLQGGSAVIMRSFDAGSWLEEIEKHKITAALLVPTQLYRILDHPRLAQSDLSSIETIFYGAAPCSPSRLAEAVGIFGQVFMQFYGQSEAPMTVCILRREDHDPTRPERFASCGRPIPGIDVQLLDEQGREVAIGEPGEICVRGPLVMNGYRNRPEETAAALADGWLHTGDVAKRDDEGYLYIVDRRKDMIVSGGFNVFPKEVEDALTAHEGVAQAAVIGVPDPDWGEAVRAFVVRREGMAVSADELAAFVREKKGPVYAPKAVEFVESLPVSPLGKVDKKALRAPYWGDDIRQVH
jgi:fatty-acyl-CoA synthase